MVKTASRILVLICFLLSANFALPIEDEFPAGFSGADERLEKLQIYFETGMYEEAAALLDELIAQFPDEPKFKYLRAIVDYQREDSEGAAKIFLEFIEQYPQMPEPYYLLAEINLKKDNQELARIYLAKYCQLVPEDIAAQNMLTEMLKENVSTTAILEDGREDGQLVKRVGFYGACLPSYQEQSLKLVNGSHRMWSSMGIDFAYPVDLRGKEIILRLKGKQGGERLELTFRDKFAQGHNPQLVLVPEENIGAEWKKLKVVFSAQQSKIDLSCVVHMGLEFGFSTVQNPVHSALYVKDIIISDVHN